MTSTSAPIGTPPRERRFAELAAVLSRASANGEVEANYALRILRHQLRVMNVNRATKVSVRSEGAQGVIDGYAEAGKPIPKNGSLDALHCDHVHALTEDDLSALLSVGAWIEELGRLREVVCVTAAENYRLEELERRGVTGWDKYGEAGVKLLPPQGE